MNESVVHLYTEVHSGIDERARLVVRDSAQWVEVWARATKRDPTPPALPTVDFRTDMVVLVGMGRQPSFGDAVRVRSVERSTSGRRVIVVTERLGPHCDAGAAFTNPVDIVRVARNERDPTFVERDSILV